MHRLGDSAALHSFLAASQDLELNALLQLRADEFSGYVDEIGDLATFLIIELHDRIDTVDAALGFSILRNRFTSKTVSDALFTPSWDSLVEHPNWFELSYVLGEDGSGILVITPKSAPHLTELLDMCARYVEPSLSKRQDL